MFIGTPCITCMLGLYSAPFQGGIVFCEFLLKRIEFFFQIKGVGGMGEGLWVEGGGGG